ncbi:protein FATTY ACID EXPORT 1, chloroplastic [Brachypodium distachyon]|uniref:protein FATTY ACID EXPORT 1, chloroplastic n=1 Tax=Brachypodium distachyon TaxID=15368 RepID=UPI000234F60F|nr:protein FATTY ACID EXPORT 1, chloroplastic [Brachypodium distachyon]|eukprot:XP_003579942.1 protein FATTY ACID EXPORT 1, chloroplastic [Brachypodium distachyon]
MHRLPAAPSRSAAVRPHISPAPPYLGLRRQHGRVAMANRGCEFESRFRSTDQLSISTNGVGMKPFGVGAKISTKRANGNTRVEELNLRSNQTEGLVETDEPVTSPKRSAKIHDFCFGIPFGGLLFCMGLLGYFFSRSTISLVLGVAPGLATLFLGILSLNFWKRGRSSFLFILGQAAISAVLAWKYSHAYLLTNRILPWGFYASLSTAMACFYAYVLLAGGNPPPKKLAGASLS